MLSCQDSKITKVEKSNYVILRVDSPKRVYIDGYNLRPDVSAKIDIAFHDQGEYKFTFAEIADFIEDNTEFYETPKQ